MVTTKRADELRVGDVGVERDGGMLDVVAVERVGQQVRVQFSAFGPGPAPSHTFRASTMVRVFVPEIEAA